MSLDFFFTAPKKSSWLGKSIFCRTASLRQIRVRVSLIILFFLSFFFVSKVHTGKAAADSRAAASAAMRVRRVSLPLLFDVD